MPGPHPSMPAALAVELEQQYRQHSLSHLHIRSGRHDAESAGACGSRISIFAPEDLAQADIEFAVDDAQEAFEFS
jgi:hypothetical protein